MLYSHLSEQRCGEVSLVHESVNLHLACHSSSCPYHRDVGDAVVMQGGILTVRYAVVGGYDDKQVVPHGAFAQFRHEFAKATVSVVEGIEHIIVHRP